MTAEAVKLSFERLLKINRGPSEAFPKDLKVDAVDEHTVKFTLSQPFAPFLTRWPMTARRSSTRRC